MNGGSITIDLILNVVSFVLVGQLTLQVLYPLVSNTKILKETVQKGY